MCIIICTPNDKVFQELEFILEREIGLRCVLCRDTKRLLRYLTQYSVNLVLLEVATTFGTSHPLFDWRVCHYRQDLPVIVFGMRLAYDSMVNALAAGASDIVVGNTSSTEILVRSKRVLGAPVKGLDTIDGNLHIGPYTLDQASRALITEQVTINLTSTEFALATIFFANPGRVVSRERIAFGIWKKDIQIVSRTLEQHIYKLRSKFALQTELRIVTHYSEGYKVVLISGTENARFISLSRTCAVDGFIAERKMEHRGGAANSNGGISVAPGL
ncbi:DNA-binding response regulator, OmpR family, contains REC and winged-helix (wHTH) domain [Burkholderia sp. OK233]|nr:DNA-binding response regulator, OmpR family, contains REC and winged-helix (wHTH) domain [Burkholderia sp. OK233]